MANLLEQAIHFDDGYRAAKIIQDALGIEFDEHVANYVFPKTWPVDREQRAASSANGCRPRRGFWRDDDAHHTVLPVRVGPGHPRRFGNLTCRPAVDQQNMMADNRPALHDCRTFEVH